MGNQSGYTAWPRPKSARSGLMESYKFSIFLLFIENYRFFVQLDLIGVTASSDKAV
jgi:hypothetical protein